MQTSLLLFIIKLYTCFPALIRHIKKKKKRKGKRFVEINSDEPTFLSLHSIYSIQIIIKL